MWMNQAEILPQKEVKMPQASVVLQLPSSTSSLYTTSNSQWKLTESFTKTELARTSLKLQLGIHCNLCPFDIASSRTYFWPQECTKLPLLKLRDMIFENIVKCPLRRHIKRVYIVFFRLPQNQSTATIELRHCQTLPRLCQYPTLSHPR